MSVALLGVILIVAIFVLSAWRNINIGTLAFPAALLLGSYADLSLDKQLAGFPVELFIVVVGITYLFGIAQANGTIDWILHGTVKLLRGRTALLPAVMFLIAFTVSAIGAVGTATLAMTLPIAMACAYRYRFSPFMMAMITTCGMQAGYFSPNAVYSATVIQLVEKAGLDVSRFGLFVSHAILNLLIAAVVWVGSTMLSARSKRGAEAEAAEPATGLATGGGPAPAAATCAGGAAMGPPTEEPSHKDTQGEGPVLFKAATLGALVLLFLGVLVFDLDPGLLSLSLGCLLMLGFASRHDGAFVGSIQWPTVLMITGIITYISVLEATGALKELSDTLSGVGDASTGILAISYVAGIISAFASSIGTMGLITPLTTPLLLANPGLPVLGSITAVTASTYLVDPSPLSILGALVLANAREADRASLFKKLTVWALAMVALSPLATWTFLVLPG